MDAEDRRMIRVLYHSAVEPYWLRVPLSNSHRNEREPASNAVSSSLYTSMEPLYGLINRTIWEAVIGNCLEKGRHFQKNTWQVTGWTICQSNSCRSQSGEEQKTFFPSRKAFRNTLKFWYNWCIYANLFSNRHCCLERTAAASCRLTLRSHRVSHT